MTIRFRCRRSDSQRCSAQTARAALWILLILTAVVTTRQAGAALGSRNGLRIAGASSYQLMESSVQFSVGRIANNSRSRTSGPLRVELWAWPYVPPRGTAAHGVRLGGRDLPPLRPRASYRAITAQGTVATPPSGRYRVSLMLKEQVNGQWVLRDYLNFPEAQSAGRRGQPAKPLKNAPAGSVPLSAGITYADILHNLRQLNTYRAATGAPPLVLDADLTKFAQQGSIALMHNHLAHNHFKTAGIWQSGFRRSAAENQGDPRGWTAMNVDKAIDQILQMMINEGPGGGHHDNLLNPAYRRVGIGLVKDDRGRLYLTNDFSA